MKPSLNGIDADLALVREAGGERVPCVGAVASAGGLPVAGAGLEDLLEPALFVGCADTYRAFG